MSNRKVITVVGATGAQGGGLVRAIVNDAEGGFTARAITRNPASEKAQALARQHRRRQSDVREEVIRLALGIVPTVLPAYSHR